MTLQWILAWWNLVFVVPFGLALLYLLVYAASGITFGDSEVEADLGEAHGLDSHDLAHASGGGDAHAEAGDLDADHDVHVDADGDAHAEVDADADGDRAESAGRGHVVVHAADALFIKRALNWLGVGRVPLSVLLMVGLFAWGAAGFVVNQITRNALGGGSGVALVSLPAALLVSLLTTHFVVRGIERYMPLDETTARRRHDLLGLSGIAMFDIGERFGMLSVRDDRGELYQVPCRLAAGSAAIAKNATAVLVAFNSRERLYHVAAADTIRTERAAAIGAAELTRGP